VVVTGVLGGGWLGWGLPTILFWFVIKCFNFRFCYIESTSIVIRHFLHTIHYALYFRMKLLNLFETLNRLIISVWCLSLSFPDFVFAHICLRLKCIFIINHYTIGFKELSCRSMVRITSIMVLHVMDKLRWWESDIL
jgi:hypothetical protein